MKKSILLVYLFLCGVSGFAQNGLELRGYFGISGTLVGPKAGMVGTNSGTTEGFKEFGLSLSYGIGQKFRINGGLSYASAEVEFSPPPCPNCSGVNELYAHNPKFEMVSIPIFAEYSLTNFLFVAAGPVVDFQLSEGNNFDDQSGLGYLVGLGGKVEKEKFSFLLCPNYKRHSVLPFENNGDAKDILREFGVQLGVGYRF